jgi:predicted heme/steroid binding protein
VQSRFLLSETKTVRLVSHLIRCISPHSVTCPALCALLSVQMGNQPPPSARVRERPNPARTFTPAQLRVYDGTDPKTPIYLSICGRVYDVSNSEHFYGPPDGGYATLSGRDASRVLAKMDFAQLQACAHTHTRAHRSP